MVIKVDMPKALRSTNIVLYVFSLWSVLVFWLRASGYIDADWLAFNLDSTHFWNRGFLYLLLISLWYVYSGKKELYQSKSEHELSFFFLLIGITLDNIGNLLGWYRVDTQYGIEWYDKAVHFLNASFFTGFFIVTFRNIYREAPYALVLIAGLGMSITLGSIFEVGEYLSDLWSDTRMVGGVEDVAMDTLMNIGGAVLTVIVSLYVMKRSSRN